MLDIAASSDFVSAVGMVDGTLEIKQQS